MGCEGAVHDLLKITNLAFFCICRLLVCLVPNPPLNVSLKIVHRGERGSPANNWHGKASHDTRLPRKARDAPLTEEHLETEPRDKQEDPGLEEESRTATQSPLATTEGLNSSWAPSVNAYTPTAEGVPSTPGEEPESENSTASYWPTGRPSPTEGEYEFVNGVVSAYEDSKELGSAMELGPELTDGANKPPSIQLELRWLPPPPHTTTDGFNVYVYRDGKAVRLRKNGAVTLALV